METSHIVKNAIDLITNRIETNGLLLFGSYARGDFKSDSDIDFVTLGDKFQREILKDTNPEVDIFTHPVENYMRILNHAIFEPFRDSVFLGILQESVIINNDQDFIFLKAINAALDWSWKDDVKAMLSQKQVNTQSLLSMQNESSSVSNHIRQRNRLFRWNLDRAKNGLPLLRRLKDIHRTDSETGVGSVAKSISSEDCNELQSLFTSLTEEVLAASNRPPFTEIKDTIKAFDSSRFDEWILSMADSLVFIASMGMANKGHDIDWKLLDVPSEIQLIEIAREKWNAYRVLHDKFNGLLEF